MICERKGCRRSGNHDSLQTGGHRLIHVADDEIYILCSNCFDEILSGLVSVVEFDKNILVTNRNVEEVAWTRYE